MDTAQWAQGIGVVKQQPVGVEGSIPQPPMSERKAKPQKDQALNCPRCNSTNTKFCYYNNYSLSQPRYFCKTCRRYWTEGGSLRNVPVGGGSRKNKRSSTCSSSSSKKLPDLNPNKIQQGQDLNLACPPPPPDDYNNSISKFIELPFSTEDKTTTPSRHHDQLSSLMLLKTGGSIQSSRTTTLCSLMPMSAASDSSGPAMYNSSDGFPSLQDFKPPSGLSFSLEGFANGYGGISGIHEGNSGDDGGARLLFPTEDLKQVPSNIDDHYEQNRSHAESTGFWNGMLGGGSW